VKIEIPDDLVDAIDRLADIRDRVQRSEVGRIASVFPVRSVVRLAAIVDSLPHRNPSRTRTRRRKALS
jgi:metal-responsive CopG/Arc/MetJ family transcriptional regulator